MTFPSFAQFFEACRGLPPYPWQSRLAQQVLANRCWPDALALPTGSGKTSAIDIALYALAVAAHEGEYGVYPRRIILVVDRRVLVDQAWRHGRRLLERVEAEPELAPVRDALLKLCPESPSCVRLRGACPTDPTWCRSPDQVQIVASTVDQIGSRLLLRGYGVTPRMRSVEAGIVGQDTLFLLDEAHLAGPFLETLRNLECCDPIRELDSRRYFVQLSATPAASESSQGFNLGADDRDDEALGRRLRAPKILRWSEERLEKTLLEIDAPCVLLVANTVDTALNWYAKTTRLRAKRGKVGVNRETFLVTGRMRPLDRGKILDNVEQRLDNREPTLVVATQCVEVGVDWDFDAMISECASWDALVQRAGRVNRRGERDDAECIILPAQRKKNDFHSNEKLCPVYGRHELETATWLQKQPFMNCTPVDMPIPPDGCVRPPESAPLLLPEYLDLWSQTRADGPAYDVSAFLHGGQQDRHVSVVWRDLEIGKDNRGGLERLLKALPPSSLEAAIVPIGKFRDWLDGRKVIQIEPKVDIVFVRDIGIGATVVVPTRYGGIGRHGTFDGSPHEVADISSEALHNHRNLEFEFHDAPPINEDELVEDQVKAWIDEDQTRSVLQHWKWIDGGRRWLFVSKLPVEPDDDGFTFQSQAEDLESHLNGVAMRVQRVAERLGLPPVIAKDLEMAAKLHDLGKLDDRFQRLCGRSHGAAPLSHSGHNWVERRRRAALSDYPTGERHEALSVELTLRNGFHVAANDRPLVEHLIASHHGWSRPFIRAAQGSARIDDRLYGRDFDDELAHTEAERAPVRFRDVQHRFGWLGLAWLEAILRLSDHRQVEAQKKGECVPSGRNLIDFDSSMPSPICPETETCLTALSGLVLGDYLATLGVLHALYLAGEHARLRWQLAQPRIETNLGISEIVDRLVYVRGKCDAFRDIWPAELNKLSVDQRKQLLSEAEQPSRSLVVAMLSPYGRSELDCVSGGRGGFKAVFDWVTDPKAAGFSTEDLLRTLVGPRNLRRGGKSFRWSPLAAQGARRPKTASNDMRTEPWIEWLSVMGISALISVPSGRIETRSTGIYGPRRKRMFQWPLWRIRLAWPEVTAALAGNETSLRDANWCSARRLSFGTAQNTTYGFGAASMRFRP